MKVSTPPYRGDHVGSLLRPHRLREARAKRARNELTPESLRDIEDEEIEKVVKKQEAIGLRSITDGEFRRSWWNLDFIAGLVGTEWTELEQGIQFKGLRTRPQAVRVSGKLAFDGHPMIEHFRFLQTKTRCTPKVTIPSPSAVYARNGRALVDETVYPDLEQFFDDVGNVYKQVILGFYDAGCRYLQLDEVYIALWCDPEHRKMLEERGDNPDWLLESYVRMINTAVAGAPEDLTIAMHLCRGNHRSAFLGEGGYEPVADVLFNRINVSNYFMEFDTERAGGFEPLRLAPQGNVVVLGLLTTKTGALETREYVTRRIDEAAKFIDVSRLCLSPQCGFASTEEGNLLTQEQQWAKLEMVVDLANQIWG